LKEIAENDIMISMSQLVVRNLEESVKTRLRRRASRRGHSMEEEVREILRNAVRVEESAPAPLGSRIRDRFARIGLEDDIAEFRGEKARHADFKR
jgi:plasmid stability protein